jgi:hypothetical protein
VARLAAAAPHRFQTGDHAMNQVKTSAGGYAGPERRSGKDRRQLPDRRSAARVQADTVPRRAGTDRRARPSAPTRPA